MVLVVIMKVDMSLHRFGVVGNANKLVKDCYIMPLSSTSPVPAALLPLSGQVIYDQL